MDHTRLIIAGAALVAAVILYYGTYRIYLVAYDALAELLTEIYRVAKFMTPVAMAIAGWIVFLKFQNDPIYYTTKKERQQAYKKMYSRID